MDWIRHIINSTNSWFDGLNPIVQFTGISALKIFVVFSVLMTIVAYAVWVERKVSAAIQDRRGPNRFGPFGLLQPAADAIKSFLKEDFTPAHVRKLYFWLAPAITLIPGIVVIAVIPFGSFIGHQKMVIADLDVGILYTFGIVSLGVYGIVLAGYASNSKFPFLGGIRSSAQLISYEIAMGMSVVAVFLLITGTLNLEPGYVESPDRLAALVCDRAQLAGVQAAACVHHFCGGRAGGNESHTIRFAGSGAGVGGWL